MEELPIWMPTLPTACSGTEPPEGSGMAIWRTCSSSIRSA
jgi:hypothetical protein